MPKWLAWVLSGAAIVGGIILCATGVGGILGGVLIGAGAGSLIGGYVSEASGGSFAAGYIGGAISGALCGVGAGLAGNLFMSLANAANFSFITFGKAVAFAYAGGFCGNMLGTMSTSWWDSGFKSLNLGWRETFSMSALAGALNVLAGIGSGMASTVAEVGKSAVVLDMKLAARILAGTIAGVAEALYDTTTYILSKIMELL